jgi:polyhydroxyalkanoate synthesis regulator phasin
MADKPTTTPTNADRPAPPDLVREFDAIKEELRRQTEMLDRGQLVPSEDSEALTGRIDALGRALQALLAEEAAR